MGAEGGEGGTAGRGGCGGGGEGGGGGGEGGGRRKGSGGRTGGDGANGGKLPMLLQEKVMSLGRVPPTRQLNDSRAPYCMSNVKVTVVSEKRRILTFWHACLGNSMLGS